MFVKRAATTGYLCLRQLHHQHLRTFSAFVLRRPFAEKTILNSKNVCQKQKDIYFYSTKPPGQVKPSNYEEVKDLPNHPEKLLVDVREPAELKEFGVIPTSINIPLGSVGQELSPNVRNDVFKAKYGRNKPNEDTEIIFHCRIGKRSATAAETALKLGYNNVKNYEGSWLDWAEHEGLPK